ncbi:Phosphohistidine phosphatase SixA [hydrothermal vent metagenome]|uniref:Phosphohistidine phosphatase SixA n=1 Tax=hydrothermal vent metagenome TaxID=652676 RepID=A0A3B0TAE6_9ZZZZ
MAGDHERPLAPRGTAAAPRMGAEMKRLGLVPDLVLCSTATRAQATVTLVLDAMDIAPKTIFDRRIYDAEAEDLIDLITEFCPGTDRILVVGHNPTMQIAASRLARDGGEEALIRLETKFPTAGLAVIDFDPGNWSGANLDGGRLAAFITPANL